MLDLGDACRRSARRDGGPILPIFAKHLILGGMSTMNISLPETLKSFVDQQVAGRGFGTSSEYVRELIRKDQDRQSLRRLLLDAAATAPTEPVDEAYFEGLRNRAGSRATR
jgi:putative addiction module CopG family antidote